MIKSSIREKKNWYITMKVINKLLDEEYPYIKTTHERIVLRGIVLNEENKIALVNVVRDGDDFGPGNYYETPGGGKKPGETNLEGVIREVEEEIGYKSTLIEEIGIVEDYYNPIFRKNINHYYLLKLGEQTRQNLESYGDFFIKGVVWVSIDEAIHLYENMNKYKIERLVRNSELPIMIIVKELLGGKKDGKES